MTTKQKNEKYPFVPLPALLALGLVGALEQPVERWLEPRSARSYRLSERLSAAPLEVLSEASAEL